MQVLHARLNLHSHSFESQDCSSLSPPSNRFNGLILDIHYHSYLVSVLEEVLAMQIDNHAAAIPFAQLLEY